MKQQGKVWFDHAGDPTVHRVLPAHIKLYEKLGQKIAAEAIATEKHLQKTRQMFVDLAKEAFRNTIDKSVKRFSFYTYDREFRIEFDVKEEYVRVYRATKKNPSSKDYEIVNLDFNRADLQSDNHIPLIAESIPEPTPEGKPADEVFDGMARVSDHTAQKSIFETAVEQAEQPITITSTSPPMSQEDYERYHG
jgi:5-hydroxyisourate hydrolase-like protein (transthyretin family)